MGRLNGCEDWQRTLRTCLAASISARVWWSTEWLFQNLIDSECMSDVAGVSAVAVYMPLKITKIDDNLATIRSQWHSRMNSCYSSGDEWPVNCKLGGVNPRRKSYMCGKGLHSERRRTGRHVGDFWEQCTTRTGAY